MSESIQIELRAGGTATLEIDAPVLSMERADRDEILAFIDAFRELGNERPRKRTPKETVARERREPVAPSLDGRKVETHEGGYVRWEKVVQRLEAEDICEYRNTDLTANCERDKARLESKHPHALVTITEGPGKGFSTLSLSLMEDA